MGPQVTRKLVKVTERSSSLPSVQVHWRREFQNRKKVLFDEASSEGSNSSEGSYFAPAVVGCFERRFDFGILMGQRVWASYEGGSTEYSSSGVVQLVKIIPSDQKMF